MIACPGRTKTKSKYPTRSPIPAMRFHQPWPSSAYLVHDHTAAAHRAVTAGQAKKSIAVTGNAEKDGGRHSRRLNASKPDLTREHLTYESAPICIIYWVFPAGSWWAASRRPFRAERRKPSGPAGKPEDSWRLYSLRANRLHSPIGHHRFQLRPNRNGSDAQRSLIGEQPARDRPLRW